MEESYCMLAQSNSRYLVLPIRSFLPATHRWGMARNQVAFLGFFIQLLVPEVMDQAATNEFVELYAPSLQHVITGLTLKLHSKRWFACSFPERRMLHHQTEWVKYLECFDPLSALEPWLGDAGGCICRKGLDRVLSQPYSRVCPVSVILYHVLELSFETILLWGMIQEKKERMWSTPLTQILYDIFWDIKSSNWDCCRISTIPFVLYSLATSVVQRNTNPAPWSLNIISLLRLNPPSSRIDYDSKLLQTTRSWNEIACTM